jgi:nucleotide-binding universal stress UspA family protein
MTKSVVVPLDGSAVAERALPTARWLSRDLGVELHLVSTTVGPRTMDQEEYLGRVVDGLAVDHVVPHVVGHLYPAPGILRTIQDLPDPVLCMTTRGASGWGTGLLGSVTDEVVRGTDEPVVLVGRSCTAVDDPRAGPIVMGIDGSDGSMAVIEVVVEWSTRLSRAVDVVATAQTGNVVGDTRFDLAHQRVGVAVDRLEAMGVDPTPHVLLGASPADLLVELASTADAALIAIGTHGRSGLSLRALGHVAAGVVDHSPCPVLVRRLRS